MSGYGDESYAGGLGTSSITVVGEAAAATATALDGGLSTAPIVIAGTAAGATGTALDGTIRELLRGGVPAIASSTALDGSILGQPVIVLGEPATATAVAVDGIVLLAAGTNTNDLANGRTRLGSAEDHTLYPVKPLPLHLQTEPRRIMAQQLPRPVLVNGVPQ